MLRLHMTPNQEETHVNKAAAIITAVILVLAIAGGSFYGGMVYGKSQAQANLPAGFVDFQNGMPGALAGGAAGAIPGQGRPFGARPSGGGGQGEVAAGAGMQMGTVKEVTDGVLVITAIGDGSNGREIRVTVTDTTLIEKNTSVKVSELEVGETLMVSGSTGADGTITARSIQVAPAGRFGFGAPGGGPDGAPGGGTGTTSDGQAGSGSGSSSRP